MCRSNNSAFKRRPTPDLVFSIFEKYNPTLFFGVPTLYSAMLNSEKIPSQISPRLCISAGEALPIDIGIQWEKKFNIKILDGIGSTEMLHIFLSNSEKFLEIWYNWKTCAWIRSYLC